MPTSALIQLVSVGQTDAFLTSNPEISHFKYVQQETFTVLYGVAQDTIRRIPSIPQIQ